MTIHVHNQLRAQIIREERDALVLAWIAGRVLNMTDAENFLNARVRALGVETMTGDTTERRPGADRDPDAGFGTADD